MRPDRCGMRMKTPLLCKCLATKVHRTALDKKAARLILYRKVIPAGLRPGHKTSLFQTILTASCKYIANVQKHNLQQWNISLKTTAHREQSQHSTFYNPGNLTWDVRISDVSILMLILLSVSMTNIPLQVTKSKRGRPTVVAWYFTLTCHWHNTSFND